MAWESHERNIIENVAKTVNPQIRPNPDGSLCPLYHPGHGWWQFHSYRKLDYTAFWRRGDMINLLEDMYDEVRVKVDNRFVITDQPFGDISGVEDDFAWRQVLVRDVIVLIAVRRRDDSWYDFCLTVFANHIDTGGPDIS